MRRAVLEGFEQAPIEALQPVDPLPPQPGVAGCHAFEISIGLGIGTNAIGSRVFLRVFSHVFSRVFG